MDKGSPWVSFFFKQWTAFGKKNTSVSAPYSLFWSILPGTLLSQSIIWKFSSVKLFHVSLAFHISLLAKDNSTNSCLGIQRHHLSNRVYIYSVRSRSVGSDIWSSRLWSNWLLLLAPSICRTEFQHQDTCRHCDHLTHGAIPPFQLSLTRLFSSHSTISFSKKNSWSFLFFHTLSLSGAKTCTLFPTGKQDCMHLGFKAS